MPSAASARSLLQAGVVIGSIGSPSVWESTNHRGFHTKFVATIADTPVARL